VKETYVNKGRQSMARDIRPAGHVTPTIREWFDDPSSLSLNRERAQEQDVEVIDRELDRQKWRFHRKSHTQKVHRGDMAEHSNIEGSIRRLQTS
jgi:hypothetical protein